MKIAVRMDDITPDMDWEKFLAFKGILDRYRIKPLIGVVPDNKDPNLHRAEPTQDFWQYIKELQKDGWSIALHGSSHVYSTSKSGLFPLNNFSEFAGISFKKQYEMIKHGKEILENNGIYTDIFMAPAHSYDKNTLKVLKELGYTRITDGFGTRPYIREGLCFYPISFLLNRSFEKKKGYTTMVIHANMISEQGIEKYAALFEKQQDKFISYTDYLNVPPVRRHLAGNVKEWIMAKSKHFLVKIKSLVKR